MPQTGDSMPSWTLRDQNRNEVRFPHAAGENPSVVIFWASWCPYCKTLMPHLSDLKAEFSEGSFEVFAINFSEREGSDPTKSAPSAFALPFVHLVNGDAVAAQYDITTVPALFVVSPEGEVLYRLDYPPSSHPSQRPERRKDKTKLLGLWWKDRLRGVMQGIADMEKEVSEPGTININNKSQKHA